MRPTGLSGNSSIVCATAPAFASRSKVIGVFSYLNLSVNSVKRKILNNYHSLAKELNFFLSEQCKSSKNIQIRKTQLGAPILQRLNERGYPDHLDLF